MLNKDLYQNILKEAEEKNVFIPAQLITILRKQFELTEDQIQSVKYHPKEAIRLEKAFAVSKYGVAYTFVEPFTTLLIQKNNGFFFGYTQVLSGQKPTYKFGVTTWHEVVEHIKPLDVRIGDDIWYPDTWYEDQACIEKIANPESPKPASKKSFLERWW